jgi:hypothetical protein
LFDPVIGIRLRQTLSHFALTGHRIPRLCRSQMTLSNKGKGGPLGFRTFLGSSVTVCLGLRKVHTKPSTDISETETHQARDHVVFWFD